MSPERYRQLSESDDYDLMPNELGEGWHFCIEFDGLLVGPGMFELNFCSCLPKTHPVYATKPALPDHDAGQLPSDPSRDAF